MLEPGNKVDGQCAYRQSAHKALLDRAGRLRHEANDLEALARIIPEDERDMPPGAGEALWALVMASVTR